MHYSITFTQGVYSALVDHLFQPGETERGAYLLCGLSRTASGIATAATRRSR